MNEIENFCNDAIFYERNRIVLWLFGFFLSSVSVCKTSIFVDDQCFCVCIQKWEKIKGEVTKITESEKKWNKCQQNISLHSIQ